MLSRRQFLKVIAALGFGLFIRTMPSGAPRVYAAAIPGGTLDPAAVKKFVTPLLIPPVMPRAGVRRLKNGRFANYY